MYIIKMTDQNKTETAELTNRLYVHEYDPAGDYVLISPAWEVNEVIDKDWRYNEAFDQRQKEENALHMDAVTAAS
jgi:hypothetical protein